MTKRIIGLVLALCLIVGILPMIATADDPASTLAIYSGNNTTPAGWEPALTAGMAPAYAKTVNGIIVTDGASETDYNLKVEWPVDGNPTLTMKNATINNDNVYPNKKDTITIGGSADFVILLEGTNYINGYLSATSYKLSAYRAPFGIAAYNTGDLTVRGTSKATDALYIDNTLGHGVDSRYGALTIENCTFDLRLHGISNSYAQHGILMEYHAAGYEDKTDLTVRNCNFSIKTGYFGEAGEFIFDDYATLGKSNCYSSFGILMTKTDAGYNAANTGDILFQNSDVYLNRKNSSGNNAAYVQYSPNGSCTFDRCDMETCYSWRVVFAYIPTVVNCASATYVKQSDSKTYTYASTDAGTAVNIRSLLLTHACGTSNDDGDCKTAKICDKCSFVLAPAQADHVPGVDDGDCTTAVMCVNPTCLVETTPASAGHVPEADDDNCATDTMCANCDSVAIPAPGHVALPRASCLVDAMCANCSQVALPGGQHRGGHATCQAPANCDECGLPYGDIGVCEGGSATCTEKAICDTCGEPYGEPLGHTGGNATCKDKAVCTRCGVPYGLLTVHIPEADDNDCATDTKCAGCGIVMIPAPGHTHGEQTDCNVAVKCTVCKKVVLPAVVHVGGTATCKDKAKCTVCGKQYGVLAECIPEADDNDCATDTKCTVCGKTTTAAPGHVHGDRPSCDVAVNCTVCGKVALPAIPHTGGTATCVKLAECAVCGKEYGELAPCVPAADDGDCTTAVNCSVCGKEVVAAATHTGGTATCLAKAKCATCGKEYGELAGCAPAADDGDCTTAVNCSICGKEVVAAAAAHTGGTATCKDKAKCTVCGKEYGELSATHTPAADDGDCTTAVNCTVCGKEVVAAAAHTGGTATCNAKAKCATCGKEYGELAACVPAADDGDCTTAVKCTVCGKDVVAAAAHTGGTATCKDKAKCTVCGKEYGELSTTHTPAADDKDCTTAVKCTVCQAEVTAAKAHAFTDKNDTTCDNAGCEHTRTVSTNPNTGDVSVLLIAAVALTSAVGFAGVTVLRKKES